MVHLLHYEFIDLSTLTSIHQGFETSGSKIYLNEDDFYWNKKYLRTEKIEDTFLLFNQLVCIYPVSSKPPNLLYVHYPKKETLVPSLIIGGSTIQKQPQLQH